MTRTGYLVALGALVPLAVVIAASVTVANAPGWPWLAHALPRTIFAPVALVALVLLTLRSPSRR
jgi:hypothetical protein